MWVFIWKKLEISSLAVDHRFASFRSAVDLLILQMIAAVRVTETQNFWRGPDRLLRRLNEAHVFLYINNSFKAKGENSNVKSKQ